MNCCTDIFTNTNDITIDHYSEAPDYENPVTIPIAATDSLIEYMDKERIGRGLAPFFSDEYENDEDGYYDFYLACSRDGVEEFYCIVTSSSDDDFSEYTIPLADDERDDLFDRINKLCKIHYGMSIEEMIDEFEKWEEHV